MSLLRVKLQRKRLEKNLYVCLTFQALQQQQPVLPGQQQQYVQPAPQQHIFVQPTPYDDTMA
jgi:hypothetical protein